MPEANLTPEQMRNILLHVQGGGDPAHAAAVADGAITPAMAQQIAAQSPDSAALLDPAQMQVMGQSSAPLAAPDPTATTPVEAAAAAPVAQVASNMPISNRAAAQAVSGDMALSGKQLLNKAAAIQAATQPEIDKQRSLDQASNVSQAQYQSNVDDASRGALAQYNQTLDSIGQKQMDSAEARQRTMDAVLQQMLTASNEAAQAAPHDFWADKSTSSRIFGILSQVAGGMANGLANQPGQPTPLDRVIQQDLDRQRLEFAQKAQKGNQASGIYNDLVKATGSQNEAYTAMYVAAQKRVLGQIEQIKLMFPDAKNNANLMALEAKAQQNVVGAMQAQSNKLLESGTALQKDAGQDLTSMANTDRSAQAQERSAELGKEGRVEAAKATAKGAEGADWTLSDIETIPGKEPLPVDKAQRPIIVQESTASAVIEREVHKVEALMQTKDGMSETEKAALIAAHKSIIVRELSKAYNSGNRPADVYNAMVAGKAPTNVIEMYKNFAMTEAAPEATLGSMKATATALRYNVNTLLGHYNRRMKDPADQQDPKNPQTEAQPTQAQ